MRFRSAILRVGIAILCIAGMLPASATAQGTATGPQLVISQLKITSSAGQFVTLYNESAGTIDLSQYELDYINTSNKLTSLPISGQLAAHSFYMLSDDQVNLCYRMTIDAQSLGLSTASTGTGSLQIWQISTDKTSKLLQDSVTWTSNKTVPAGVISLPTQNAANTVSLLREPTDSSGNPQISVAGLGVWQAVQPDAANACNLDMLNSTSGVASPTSNPGNTLGTGQAPPSTIISVAGDDAANGSNVPVLPVADVGLSAPQITELLPNPDGTGNDDTDEFIELYNPNTAEFHLVGFTLQTGSTTKHNYTFPDGTVLEPQSFTAFYSSDTGLSLSNTSGQADLLDPFGNLLGQTDAYGTAKDGQAWALASGVWYWTSQPTPNAANVVSQAAATAKSSKSTTAGKSSSGVKGASTSSNSASSSGSSSASDTTAPAPIHPFILVAVGVLAVGYGVYEYRHDLANIIHRFRRHRTAGRTARA